MKTIFAGTPLILLFALQCPSAQAAKPKKTAGTQAREAAGAGPAADLTNFSFVADGSRLQSPSVPLVTAFAQGGPIMRPYDDRVQAAPQRPGPSKINVLPPAFFPAPGPARDPSALKQYALGAGAAGLLLLLADLALLGKARQGDKAVREAERRFLHSERLRADQAEHALRAELQKNERLSQALEERAAAYEAELERHKAQLVSQREELGFARKRLAVLEEEAEARAKRPARPAHDHIESSMDADHGSVVWSNALGVLLDRIDDSVRAINSHLGPRRGPDRLSQNLRSIDADLKKAGDLVQNVQTFIRAKSGDMVSNVQVFLRKDSPPLV